MRISILTQVLPPEVHPTGVMVAELAGSLAEAGHDVTISAGFPHHPGGRLLGGYRKRLFLSESHGTHSVVRSWHLTSTSRSIPVRAAVMLSQALGTAMAALRAPRPDVVLSFGPPLIGPLLAAMVARIRGAALVSVIYDLYPDIAVESGVLSNPSLIRVARWMEQAVYRASDRIVVLSQGFRRTLVARGVPDGQIEILPVWLDPDEIRPGSRCNRFREANGIPESALVVLYAGTIGLVSGAGIMLEVAERLRSLPDALVLFVGEGQVKDEVEGKARTLGLPNVRFLPFQPREVLAEVQAASDVSVVTLLPGRGRTSVPSKVAGYMAAGRPVVASVDGDSDTADCVRNAGCGAVVLPGDSAALADSLRRLLLDRPERERMGRAARAAFERDFAGPAVLGRYLRMVEGVGKP
jgi:colanic acid biosynthesis glycosyl transferase WcaI